MKYPMSFQYLLRPLPVILFKGIALSKLKGSMAISGALNGCSIVAFRIEEIVSYYMRYFHDLPSI